MCAMWHLTSPIALSVPCREGSGGPSVAAKEAYMQCMRAGHGGNALLKLILLFLFSRWVKCCSIQCLCESCLPWQPQHQHYGVGWCPGTAGPDGRYCYAVCSGIPPPVEVVIGITWLAKSNPVLVQYASRATLPKHTSFTRMTDSVIIWTWCLVDIFHQMNKMRLSLQGK